MKHFFIPLAALVFAAPVWAQDSSDSASPGAGLNDGPARSDIADLLERLDSEAPETPAADVDDTSDSLLLRGDDGTEVDIPAGETGGDAGDEGQEDATEAAEETEGPAADPEEAPVTTDDTGEAPEDEDTPQAGGTSDGTLETDPENEPGDTGPEGSGTEEGQPVEDAVEEESGTSGAEDSTADTNGTGESDSPETAESDSAEAAAQTLTPATPFLTGTQYLELRPESAGEALELVWSVRRESVEGEALGDAVIRTLVIAPDFVRDTSRNEISVYDFLTSRHLEIDAEAGTMTNTAYEAEVRRRLDTYLGLSQGGRLTDIPLGPDRTFNRFWLEAAMGIRREPASLIREYEDGALTVQRTGGLTVLSASFAVEDSVSPENETGTGDVPDTASDDGADDGADSISEAARPVDLSSGESVVFNLSGAASPINFDQAENAVAYPDGNPAEQAQAEVLRRWMRHALPVHPDALDALEGAPRIPEEFAFFVISPESPEGRREIWTLESIESVEPGLRLAAGLEPAFDGRGLIGDRLVPLARTALESGTRADPQYFLDEIETHRAAGDHVRAWLVSLQEQNHNGACPPAGQDPARPVCAEVNGLISAGLGDSAFEQLFGLIAGPVGTGNEQMVAAMEAYRDDNNLAGAAARVLTAKALLAWAAIDPEGPPESLSPFDLLAEALEIDPLASGVWWETGNALLVLRDPLSGWTVFDTGRSILPPGDTGLLQQASALEDRLRTLAPDFFLPR